MPPHCNSTLWSHKYVQQLGIQILETIFNPRKQSTQTLEAGPRASLKSPNHPTTSIFLLLSILYSGHKA